MNEFFQRLKERKLVQWAIAYVAGTLALLQGTDIVAQQFGWPDGVRRGMTLALVVGFIVTLLLAWYHGKRGAQKVSGTELLIIGLDRRFRARVGEHRIIYTFDVEQNIVHLLAIGHRRNLSDDVIGRSILKRVGYVSQCRYKLCRYNCL